MSKKRRDEDGPDFLEFLSAIIEIEIKSLSVSEDVAKSFAKKVATRVSSDWGANDAYIHKGFWISERDMQIFKEFTGNNRRRLALKYKISERQIYSIIEKVKAAESRKRQGDLFGFDDVPTK